ncbi:HEAT repeat domain-containing protein [Streptomyces albidoflavus]
MTDVDPDAREYAYSAVAGCWLDHEEARMAALEALVQPVPGHRAVVLRALGNRLSTGEFGSEVRRALTEPDAEVREAVIAAVGGWRDHTEHVADDLLKAASDAEPAVRERALEPFPALTGIRC